MPAVPKLKIPSATPCFAGGDQEETDWTPTTNVVPTTPMIIPPMRSWMALVANDNAPTETAPITSSAKKTNRPPSRSVNTPIGARSSEPVRIGAALSQTAIPSLISSSEAITRTDGPNITHAAKAAKKLSVFTVRILRGRTSPGLESIKTITLTDNRTKAPDANAVTGRMSNPIPSDHREPFLAVKIMQKPQAHL